VLRSMALALPETLFLGVPVELWLGMWTATGDAAAAYRSAFLSIYGLEIVTIGESPDEYEAVAPCDGYLAYWVSWSLFVVTSGAACLTGCQQSTVP